MARGSESSVNNGHPHSYSVKEMRREIQQKDTFIAWIRGEFAAANAIIDALCHHVREVGEPGEYEAAMACIQRRRMLWIPVLQMQHYYSVADVASSLHRVASEKTSRPAVSPRMVSRFSDSENRSSKDGDHDSGSPEENSSGCSDKSTEHDEDNHIEFMHKTTEFFEANELVDGKLINIAEGLKLHETVFEPSKLLQLTKSIQELQLAGQEGNLKGQTYIPFKRPIKGNGRETLQFGVPVITKKKKGQVDETQDVEPIPKAIENVINHLVQQNLISGRRPDCCIINFFNEGDYSQPHLSQHRFERPIYTIALAECSVVLGRAITMDNRGNYHGTLNLSLAAGSVMSLQGNSIDIAKHAISSSLEKRIFITFAKVLPRNHPDPTHRNFNQPQSLSLSEKPQPGGHPGTVNGFASHQAYKGVGTPTFKRGNGNTSFGLSCAPLKTQRAMVQGIQTSLTGLHGQTAAAGYPPSPVAVLAPAWSGYPGIPRMPSSGTGVFLPCGEALSDPKWPLALSAQQGLIFVSQMLPRYGYLPQPEFRGSQLITNSLKSPEAHRSSEKITPLSDCENSSTPGALPVSTAVSDGTALNDDGASTVDQSASDEETSKPNRNKEDENTNLPATE